jgi:hypothetical protein
MTKKKLKSRTSNVNYSNVANTFMILSEKNSIELNGFAAKQFFFDFLLNVQL